MHVYNTPTICMHLYTQPHSYQLNCVSPFTLRIYVEALTVNVTVFGDEMVVNVN